MAKAIIARTKEMLLLSSWKQHRGTPRTVRRFTGIKQQQEESAGQVASSGEEGEVPKMPLWVPHLKTGIYFPKGHERVMDDVPERAASLAETYWLRSIDGTDKPDPDPCTYTDI